jgi:hypothetical protein
MRPGCQQRESIRYLGSNTPREYSQERPRSKAARAGRTSLCGPFANAISPDGLLTTGAASVFARPSSWGRRAQHSLSTRPHRRADGNGGGTRTAAHRPADALPNHGRPQKSALVGEVPGHARIPSLRGRRHAPPDTGIPTAARRGSYTLRRIAPWGSLVILVCTCRHEIARARCAVPHVSMRTVRKHATALDAASPCWSSARRAATTILPRADSVTPAAPRGQTALRWKPSALPPALTRPRTWRRES